MSYLKPFSSPDGYLLIYIFNEGIRKTYLVHRLVVLECIDNPENRSEVYHIDHDPTNNCIKVLRWSSGAENNMNRNKQQKPCSSNFKGVSWHKPSQKWQTRTTPDSGNRIYLGPFDDEINVAQAYNDEAQRLYGAFANLNIL